MKNEQRIWNKSELEQMDEWSVFSNGNWYTDNRGILMIGMLGQPVQWCKDNGYTVTDEMIAKTETALVQEAVSQANDKLTECLDKGEIGITILNGTTLTIGNKYRLEDWHPDNFMKITFIGIKVIVAFGNYGEEYTFSTSQDWLPYEPKEEPKPLEGYQKYFSDNGNGMLFIQYWATRPNNTANMKWYDETEAINLGLNLK